MADLRILATADLHVADTLGLAGLHPTGPGGQPLVLEQARATLAWIGDLVLSEGPDVVIVAGADGRGRSDGGHRWAMGAPRSRLRGEGRQAMPYCIKCGARLGDDDARWGCARLGLCRECAYEEAPPGSGLPPLVPTAAAREAMKTRGGKEEDPYD